VAVVEEEAEVGLMLPILGLPVAEEEEAEDFLGLI
jgi:hypothetical protein